MKALPPFWRALVSNSMSAYWQSNIVCIATHFLQGHVTLLWPLCPQLSLIFIIKYFTFCTHPNSLLESNNSLLIFWQTWQIGGSVFRKKRICSNPKIVQLFKSRFFGYNEEVGLRNGIWVSKNNGRTRSWSIHSF